MVRGWFGERQKHSLASKGVRSSFRRSIGRMHTKADTWDLREEFIRNHGYLNEKEFEQWVINTTKKSPYHSEYHISPKLAGNTAFGIKQINKDNLVDYIISYESGELEEQDMVNLFAYLIKTGQAWSLQGHYGRTASNLIDYNIIDKEGNIIKEKFRSDL